MKNQLVIFVFCLIGIFYFNTLSAQDRAVSLMERSMNITYKSYDLDMNQITADKSKLPKEVASGLGKDKIYKVSVDGKFAGYAYLGEAPSKERMFDYFILFDTDLSITKIEVLIYRENFGREINTQRWLNQFTGMKPGSAPKFGEDIDGISGATISARNMTVAVSKVLKTMEALQKAQLL